MGDIAGMAAQATALLKDPARLALFGERARKRAEEHFNPEDIIPRYEAFY
jgi:glycosyltransferase involved in cell wall biosynthesis